ncbi:MAG TPA: NifU family protein [Candidatus Bathyarchaeia archaeon]
MSETFEKKVQKALDEIRPNIQADGGDIELVAIDNGVVKVRLQGHCVGCPMSALTLKQGVEAHLKRRVPEVVKVESVQ